jgi:hypothetical protein
VSPAARGRKRSEDTGRVRIPADVDRPDQLLAGLTARQLAILAAAAVALWAGYAATRHVVPAAAWRHRRSPRRLVPAPDGVPAGPGFLANAAGSHPPALPAPLRLPLAGIDARGVVDLGADGLAVICRASAVTFSLRTPAEQEALVAGFARFLNSLAEPVQVLVRAEPLDVGPAICALLDAAPGLPHLALERAARDHATFLADLAATRALLRREVLIVLRQPMGQPAGQSSNNGDGPGRLLRRAAEAVTALGAAGVSLSVLDGAAAGSVIARCLDPAGPPRPGGLPGPGDDEPVTLAHHRTSLDPTGSRTQEGAIR